MRYTLAGGMNYAAENVSGPACPRQPGKLYRETPVFELLEEGQEGLMNSPGHRTNILNKWHKRVNLGISCDNVGCSIVQLFEGDYAEFSELPTLFNGVLHMAGHLSSGFELTGVDIWYDPPAHPLTLGQLGQTRSYGLGGEPAAFIREPLGPGYHYTESSTDYSWDSGIDPYTVDPSVLPPSRILLGDEEQCVKPPSVETVYASNVPWITASVWEVSWPSFQIEVDLGQVLEGLGPGVYTVIIWGEKDGESVALTNYDSLAKTRFEEVPAL